VCGPHGDAACHILDSLICSKKNLSTDMHQGCLVGGLEHVFYFPFHIWDVILPID